VELRGSGPVPAELSGAAWDQHGHRFFGLVVRWLHFHGSMKLRALVFFVTAGALLAYATWFFNLSIACEPAAPDCSWLFKLSVPSWKWLAISILVASFGAATFRKEFLTSLSIRARTWIGLNAVGVVVFLLFSSKLWIPDAELGQGFPGGPGDAFYWLFVLVPFQLSFVIADVLATFGALLSARRQHSSIPIAACGFVVGLWAFAEYLNYVRTFRFITLV
jgi:hypothetical protein